MLEKNAKIMYHTNTKYLKGLSRLGQSNESFYLDLQTIMQIIKGKILQLNYQ